MHCKLEELFLVLTLVPALFLHHLAELRQFVRELVLRVAGVELQALGLGKFPDFRSKFARQCSHTAQNHVPGILVDGGPSRLSVQDVHQVHQ